MSTAHALPAVVRASEWMQHVGEPFTFVGNGRCQDATGSSPQHSSDGFGSSLPAANAKGTQASV